MKHAFEKAGWSAADNDFDKAIALYLNRGGTIERAHALVERRSDKAMKGHSEFDAQKSDADHRLPDPDAGQKSNDVHDAIAGVREPVPGSGQGERETHPWHAADQDSNRGQSLCETHKESAPKPGGAGHSKSENPMHVARSVREPNDNFRRALARDRHQTNAIWLATHKTSDGRFWSKVCPREFVGMHRDSKVAGVIEKVYGPFNPKQMNMELGNLITPAMEHKIIKMLERQDAA